MTCCLLLPEDVPATVGLWTGVYGGSSCSTDLEPVDLTQCGLRILIRRVHRTPSGYDQKAISSVQSSSVSRPPRSQYPQVLYPLGARFGTGRFQLNFRGINLLFELSKSPFHCPMGQLLNKEKLGHGIISNMTFISYRSRPVNSHVTGLAFAFQKDT